MRITQKKKFINRYSEIPQEKNIINENNNNINKISQGIGSDDINEIPSKPIETGEYIENKNINIKKYDNPTENILVSPKQFFPLNKPKTLCFNCLHMILQEHCINKFKKPFCSLHCLEIYEKKNKKKVKIEKK